MSKYFFKAICLGAVLFALSQQLHAQGETKSGLVISAGAGNIETLVIPSFQGNTNKIENKLNVSVGYRFRFHPSSISPFFLDLDANLGIQLWHASYDISRDAPPKYDASSQYYFVSTRGTLNYPVYKGLSIGVGFEPTYYFLQNGENSKNHFDIPAVGKIGYDFKAFGLGAGYKYGWMNAIKTDHIDSGKFRNWEISLWIPF